MLLGCSVSLIHSVPSGFDGNGGSRCGVCRKLHVVMWLVPPPLGDLDGQVGAWAVVAV